MRDDDKTISRIRVPRGTEGHHHGYTGIDAWLREGHGMTQLHIFVAVLSQFAFTASGLLFRYNFLDEGHAQIMSSWWLWSCVGLQALGVAGMFFVFTRSNVGMTFALMSAVGILLASIIGALWIGDAMSTKQIAGVALAVAAIILMMT